MPAHGLAFAVVVAALLLVDLGLLQRPGRPVSVRIGVAVDGHFSRCWPAAGRCGWAGPSGRQPAIEFATGYLIEGSLSVDNLFVFLILFRALRLDAEQQRRVLLWGVLGAIVLRGVLIVAGTTLLARFAWIQYAFGALLAFAALRSAAAEAGGCAGARASALDPDLLPALCGRFAAGASVPCC